MMAGSPIARGMPDVPPELGLLLWSSLPPSEKKAARLSQLLAQRPNWSEVLASAIHNKVEPVVDELVRRADPSQLDEAQRNAVAAIARSSARNSLIFLGEMLRLYSAFAAGGIPAVPFKGPALGLLAYPTFSRRTCVDLDFVLPQQWVPQATALLESVGYAADFTAAELEAGAGGKAPGQYSFSTKAPQIHVELHTEKTLRYFARPLDLDEMRTRLISLQAGGRTVRTFSVEDMLVMLCVHGAKHFWERLAWIVDVAQLVTVCKIDWKLLFEISGKMQSTRLLLLGLYLAHEMLEAPLPPEVLKRAEGDARVRRLAAEVYEQFASKSHSNIGVLRRAAFRLRSSDGYLRGVRHLIRLSTSPTESDRAKVALPAFLSPAYALVRPLRLLGEYGFGWKRSAKPDLAIYEPTPPEVVERMLSLAGISAGDVLYDLGCGDGRIVVAAAKTYGVKAVGIDINPKRIAEARANARRSGVEKQVQFILGDAKTLDVSEASVVTMFLGADANLLLADRLRAQLPDGARIVSRNFQIYGWEPDRTENYTTANGAPNPLYLWRIRKSKAEPAGPAPTPPKAAGAR